jgi:hypothetical protein
VLCAHHVEPGKACDGDLALVARTGLVGEPHVWVHAGFDLERVEHRPVPRAISCDWIFKQMGINLASPEDPGER